MASNPDIWTFPDSAGVRLLALEDSDFIFMERADSDAMLSIDAARKLTVFGSLATDNSVALFNQDDRVEALFDLDLTTSLLSTDFSAVSAVALMSHLSQQIGTFTRRARLASGLWSIDFAVPHHDSVMRTLVETLVLEPWISRRNLKVHTSLTVPSSTKVFGKRGVAEWQCTLVSLPENRPHDKVPDRILRYFNRGREIGHSHRELIHHHHLHSGLGEYLFTGRPKSPDVEVTDATKALDAFLESLSQPPEVAPHQEKSSEIPTVDPVRTSDPIQNAIEIREALEKSVAFVDSKKWAQWKGIKSNPAAAIGKYKDRIFAVRSSKRNLYPAFQFNEHAEPLAVMQEILTVVPKKSQGWSLLSWFDAENVLLKGKKPSEAIATEPEAVFEAAARFYSRDD